MSPGYSAVAAGVALSATYGFPMTCWGRVPGFHWFPGRSGVLAGQRASDRYAVTVSVRLTISSSQSPESLAPSIVLPRPSRRAMTL